MIGVIDYRIGNVNSVVNMLKKIGVLSRIVNSAEEIEKVDKLIIPGVGSFDAGIKKLRESGLVEPILKHAVREKKPILGICLGMQMLGRKSDEGEELGLSLIPFDSVKFKFNKVDGANKIPHMGWNYVDICLKEDKLVKGLANDPRFYFVHSYHALCDSDENILMKCKYGYEFPAAVKKGNIYGLQFHPEKSHKYGMVILKNFTEIS